MGNMESMNRNKSLLDYEKAWPDMCSHIAGMLKSDKWRSDEPAMDCSSLFDAIRTMPENLLALSCQYSNLFLMFGPQAVDMMSNSKALEALMPPTLSSEEGVSYTHLERAVYRLYSWLGCSPSDRNDYWFLNGSTEFIGNIAGTDPGTLQTLLTGIGLIEAQLKISRNGLDIDDSDKHCVDDDSNLYPWMKDRKNGSIPSYSDYEGLRDAVVKSFELHDEDVKRFVALFVHKVGEALCTEDIMSGDSSVLADWLMVLSINNAMSGDELVKEARRGFPIDIWLMEQSLKLNDDGMGEILS